jgi:hypothetical protein
LSAELHLAKYAFALHLFLEYPESLVDVIVAKRLLARNILPLFAAAVISSIVWYEAAERNLTRTQKTVFGVTALLARILVLVVGNIVT